MPAVRIKLKSALIWVRRHRIFSLCLVLLLAISIHAVVYFRAESGTSPAAKKVRLGSGKTVAYERIEGNKRNGPRVIFVHGAPTDSSCWSVVLDEKEDIPAREFIVIDRLGYGNSTAGPVLKLADHAASLKPFLGAQGKPPPILVGHSYGGPVILRAAVDYPDRVGGLVLVAGACDPYMNDSQGLRQLVNSISSIVPEPWEVANRELLALTDENRAMEPLLQKVKCPVIVIHGTLDLVCPFSGTTEYLKKSLVNSAGVEIVELKMAGHNLHLHHPDKIRKAIGRLAQRSER